MGLDIAHRQTLTDEEIDELAAMLAASFHAENWANAMTGKRYVEAKELWEAFFANAVVQDYSSGHIYTIGKADALLSLIPPGKTAAPDKESKQWARFQKLLAESSPEQAAYFNDVFPVLIKKGKEAAHPNKAHEKSWHAHVLGVAPSSQGKGYGAALLRFALDKAKKDKVEATIEASVEKNTQIYQHVGFKVVGITEIPHSFDDSLTFTTWFLRTPEEFLLADPIL